MSGCRSPMPRTCSGWPAICFIPTPRCASRRQALAAGLGPQSSLWPTSISGDFPIFALRIGDVADLEIVASTLRMQEYMRARGVVADLVIVNEQASSYVQDLQQAIEWLCESSRLRGSEHGTRQHIFAVRRDLMDERTYRTLLSAARIVLHTRNGPIFDQIERAESGELQPKLAAITEALAGDPGRNRRGPRSHSARHPGPRARRLRPGLLERLWRFRRRRPRICGAACRRSLDPASVDQCDGQFLVRLPYFRRGRVLHLEPQQPRFPADAVDQRPRAQSSGRSNLHLRPGLRTRLLAVSPRSCATPPSATKRGTARAIACSARRAASWSRS